MNQNIVDTAIFLDRNGETGLGSLFTETAKLSEVFFEQLKKHPVPLEEAAIRAIKDPALKAFAQNTSPTLQQHLQMVEALNTKL